MSLVLCAHICDCSCHGPTLHRGPFPEIGKKHLIEVPTAMHVVPCCDGKCPTFHCGKYIKTGMMEAHLIECHGIAEKEAKELCKNGVAAWQTP